MFPYVRVAIAAMVVVVGYSEMQKLSGFCGRMEPFPH
jgi:hypothetical protein